MTEFEKNHWNFMTMNAPYAGNHPVSGIRQFGYESDGNNGYKQELVDSFVASHSAYSYEDLPTDKFGAEFGVNHFNPNSDLTFGQQVENYLNNVLEATTPEKAPNYNSLPITDARVKNPSRVNTSTSPVYIDSNP